MMRAIIVYALTALAASATAYTYTSEKGRFTIEVPVGWTVEENSVDGSEQGPIKWTLVNIKPPPRVKEFAAIMHYCDRSGFEDSWRKERGKEFTLSGYHDVLVDEFSKNNSLRIARDKYLTPTEVRAMNVRSGFISYFASTTGRDEGGVMGMMTTNSKMFIIMSGASDEVGSNAGIKILNSFRAFD